MRAVLVAGVLIVSVAAAGRDVAAKGGAVSACSLLSADDIAAATGVKVGEGHESDTPITAGPQKGETLRSCTWKLGAQGMVSVHVVPAATGGARDTGLGKIRQTMDQLKSQGWSEDKQTFGSVTCSTMTPPPAQKSMPVAAGCMGEAKGMGVGVGSMAPGSAVALAKMKALFDKATSRLP
jgi:hypothetical protein